MNRRLIAAPWVAIAVMAQLVGVVGSGVAEKLSGPPNKVLDDLVGQLHAKKIDVRTSWQGVDALPAQDRATLAVLEGYPTDVALPAGTDWMAGFVGRDMAYLGAVRPRVPLPAPGSSRAVFDRAWTSAEPGRRVFLSFTSKDLHRVEPIRQALADQGYQTFLFIDHGAQHPDLPIELVRRYFDQADVRLVLDTPNARASSGVWLEAKLASRLRPLSRSRMNFQQTTDAFLDSGPFPDLEKRLGKSLPPEQAKVIARRAPSRSMLERVAAAVEGDPLARSEWAKLNDLGVEMAFEGDLALAREAWMPSPGGGGAAVQADHHPLGFEPLRRPVHTAANGVRLQAREGALRELKRSPGWGSDLTSGSVDALGHPGASQVDIDRNVAKRLEQLRDVIKTRARAAGSTEAELGLRGLERRLAASLDRDVVGDLLRLIVREAPVRP